MAERVQTVAKKPEAKRENKVSQIQKTDPFQSISSPVEQILFLQRTIGNQAVGMLIQSGGLQAKLRIGQPGDIYEQEADRVAEQVMSMPEPQVSKETGVSNPARNNSIQRKCPGCNKGTKIGKEEDEEKLQKKEATGSTPDVVPELESSINAIRGGGRPLPESVRAFYEPRFGTDLSGVRVHTGSHAAETAKSINSKAFTIGNNIVFGRGQFAPDSHEGQRLMGHELTHVVQQTGGSVVLPHGLPGVQRPGLKSIGEKNGSEPMSSREGRQLIIHKLNDVAQECTANNPFSAARFTPAPMLQRAMYYQYEGIHHLLLWITFGNELIFHNLTLEQDVADFFVTNFSLAQNVENELGLIFNPPARGLHETVAYLQSAAVFQLIVRGVRQLLTTGRTNFSELADLLIRRTNLFYEQNLLPAATNHLAGALGIDPAAIDWNALLPALRTQARNFEPSSVIEAALRDRYDMFLDMLGNEAGALPPVVGAANINPETAGHHLYDYVTTQGSALFIEDVYDYHSEKFVDLYLPLLEAIHYVPEQFDLQSFQPTKDTSRIDAARERIVADFIAREGESRVMIYVLDRWTESRASPEEFLRNLDLEQFRDRITTDLAEELIKRAKSDPELMAALRSRAADQARFTQVAWIVGYGRMLEQHNKMLRDTFLVVPLADLSSEDRAIAANPYAYYGTSLQISAVLNNLFGQLSPNGPIELQTVSAAASVLSALDMPAGYAPLLLLPELLGYIGALRNALEEQKRQTQSALKERLDLDFERIATVVRAFAEHADSFIREEWIPMLKQVALERITANRNDIQAIYDNLNVANEDFIARLTAGADEFELLAVRLEEESYESIEMKDQTVTRDDLSYLRQAAQFMRDEASARSDPERLEQQRAELQEALDVYDTVRADIQSDEYDPLDYSREVYLEARQRLGISEFPEFTTVGMVLTGGVTATKNPFLAQAIVGWHWREGVERQFETGLLLGGLLIFSVAGMLVPGVGGLILFIIDIGIGVGMGVHQIANAYELLNMARLDIHRDIRGVSVEEAERALHHAWIGLGVTVVLTFGPMALSSALRVRGGGIELPPAVRQWEEGLSDATQQLFRRDPALRQRFATMSPTARRLLTHCSRLCVPPGLQDADVARIENLATRMERDPRGYSEADEWMLREYLYARQDTIGTAIADVEGAANLAQLRSLMRQAASRRALSVPVPAGPVAASGYPGRWGDIRSPDYGHSVGSHGRDLEARSLMDRARDPRRAEDVGQWYDNSLIIKAEQRATAATIVRTYPNGKTVHDFDMGQAVGRVFTPTGSIVSDVTRVRVVRFSNGRLDTSFPIQ